MEIADFFVLNKSDRDGADQAVRALTTILTFRITHSEDEWIPSVIKTTASKGEGIAEVIAEIDRHRSHLEKTGLLALNRSKHQRDRITELVESMLRENLWTAERKMQLSQLVASVMSRQLTPYDAADTLAADFRK